MAYDIQVVLTGTTTANILFSDGSTPAPRTGSIVYGGDTSYANGSVGASVSGSNYVASIDFTGLTEIHFHCLIGADDSGDRFFEATDANLGTATVGSSQVDVTWDTSPRAGLGSVTLTNPDGTNTSAAEVDPVTGHDLAFPDLAPGQYGFQIQTDYDVPNDLTVVSLPSPSGFTVAQPVNVSPPGMVRASASPMRITVGQASVLAVTVTDKTGAPQVGIPVVFNIKRGDLQGSLSAANGLTDSSGQCQSTFQSSALPAGKRRGRCAIQMLVGAEPNTKKRHSVIIASIP
jgi:hypothetical protein